MAVKLILVIALVLESCGIFALEIHMGDTFNLSYGFGSPSVLSNLGVTEGFSFYQNMDLLVNGEIMEGLYIYANIGASSDQIALNYVPLNLEIGNTFSSMVDGRNLSIFGLSSPNFSFGQLSGSVEISTVIVSAMNSFVTLGQMMYGSVTIYYNGNILNPALYTVDYMTGTIYFSDLSTPEILTIEYQSALQNSGSYIFTASMGSNQSNDNLNLFACTVFSTQFDQFFISGKIGDRKNSMNLNVNFDQIPSFKVNTQNEFSVSSGLVKTDLSYTSEGFRYPIGIIQNSGFAGNLSLSGTSSKMNINFDQNDFGISVDASTSSFIFSFSKSNGLNLSLYSNGFGVTMNSQSTDTSIFGSFSNGNLNIMTWKSLQNSNFYSMIQLATPLSLQASISSSGAGIFVSKFVNPFNLSFGLTKSASNIIVSAGLNENFFSSVPGCWALNISAGSTLLISGSLNYFLQLGNLSFNASTAPAFGFSFSTSNYAAGCQITQGNINFSISAGISFFGLNFDGNMCIENLGSQWGSMVGLKVWGES